MSGYRLSFSFAYQAVGDAKRMLEGQGRENGLFLFYFCLPFLLALSNGGYSSPLWQLVPVSSRRFHLQHGRTLRLGLPDSLETPDWLPPHSDTFTTVFALRLLPLSPASSCVAAYTSLQEENGNLAKSLCPAFHEACE